MAEEARSEAPEPTSNGADELEAAVAATIKSCDGDPRAAVRALILSNAYLENQVETLSGLVSPGYARKKIKKAVSKAQTSSPSSAS